MCTWSSKSVFGSLVCAGYKILGGFTKWALRNNSRKKAENGDFQIVGSLLYAHYPIH